MGTPLGSFTWMNLDHTEFDFFAISYSKMRVGLSLDPILRFRYDHWHRTRIEFCQVKLSTVWVYPFKRALCAPLFAWFLHQNQDSLKNLFTFSFIGRLKNLLKCWKNFKMISRNDKSISIPHIHQNGNGMVRVVSYAKDFLS